MRTTLTLDDDVAAKLRAVARRSGQSFKATVNDLLRLALNAKRPSHVGAPFRVRARDMGLREGLSVDDIGAVLEQVEGAEAP